MDNLNPDKQEQAMASEFARTVVKDMEKRQQDQKDCEKSKKQKTYISAGLLLGTCLGYFTGLYFLNDGLTGVCAGICLGVMIGGILSGRANKR